MQSRLRCLHQSPASLCLSLRAFYPCEFVGVFQGGAADPHLPCGGGRVVVLGVVAMVVVVVVAPLVEIVCTGAGHFLIRGSTFA